MNQIFWSKGLLRETMDQEGLVPMSIISVSPSSLSASVVVLMGFKSIFTKLSSDQRQTLK